MGEGIMVMSNRTLAALVFTGAGLSRGGLGAVPP
jgi:hypothetical protein